MANYQKLERPVANESEPVRGKLFVIFLIKNKTFNLYLYLLKFTGCVKVWFDIATNYGCGKKI